MYNAHRGLPPSNNNRMMELLDQVRQEYESTSRSSGEIEHQMTTQVQEMEVIRQKLFQIEQGQLQMKQEYEAEIRKLRMELQNHGIAVPASHIAGGPSHAAAAQGPPPTLGHGPNNAFSGIITNQGGAAGLAPPPPPQDQAQASQHPLQPPAPGAQPPPQPQEAGYPGYPNGAYPGAPAPTSSPGPGKGRGRAPGPATPQQTHQVAYPDARPSPQIPRAPAEIPYRNINNLGDLDYEKLNPAFKKDGQDWFAVFNPEVPRVLDVELVHHLEHNSVVCCVRFSADGKYVATGCNRSAQIFDVNTGKLVTTLQDDTVDKDGDLYIRSVCFSPDGKFLATGAEDKQIRVWDIGARKIRHVFSGHHQDIYSLDFARNGRYIASGSGDKSVRLWDMMDGKQELTLSIEDGVTTVAISPDGRYVAAGSLDRSVRVWDTTTGYLVERLEGPDGHQDSVYSVAFAPNGQDLVSGSLDKTIKMWQLTPPRGLVPGTGPKGGKCARTFEGHRDFVLSVCLTPDGKWVMSGSKDRGVKFWDPDTGIAHMMLQGHKNSVISVAPSPTGTLFATGSGDMKARIWRYTTRR